MSSNQERSSRPNLSGLLAYLDLVYEHIEDVRHGRRVMFGHGRLSTRVPHESVRQIGDQSEQGTTEEERTILGRGQS